MAAARAVAIDTARIALAPRLDLSFVPSALIIAASTAYVSEASIPSIASLIVVLIFSTAFVTPFPRYLDLSPSLNSSASNSPVEAPLGAHPLATVPSASVISASTVGFPLESSISLPYTSTISKYSFMPPPCFGNCPETIVPSGYISFSATNEYLSV